MLGRRKYIGEAKKIRGVLKFVLKQDGITCGYLTPAGFHKWQECQKLTNSVAADAVSLRRKTL